MPPLQTQLSRARIARFGALLLLLSVIGGWLAVDFLQERDRILAETSRLAIHKSQLMSRSFGDTFLAADYVLRDVIGRIGIAKDLVYPHPDASVTARLDALVKEKVDTVVGLTELAILNGDCLYVAMAKHPFQGRKSRQRFCTEARVEPGQALHIEYIPPEKAFTGRASVVMSRTVGSPEGRLLAGAMVAIHLDEYAQKWIAAIETDRDDVLAIVDTDGTLLARNPPQPEALGRRTSPPPNQPSFAEVGKAATFTTASPVDGHERVYGLSRLERFPFVAIVGFDKTRVLSGWQRRAWQFAVVYILLAVLSVLALRAYLATVRQREEMRNLATTDTLTGIANRRHFMDIANREFIRVKRHGNPLSVLMLDIDKFKLINDRWGHPSGDRVIQELARVIMSVVRAQDTGSRLGGEEFAVILPETDASGAEVIAERLRKVVEASEATHADDGTAVRFTVSIGIASLAADDGSFDAMLQRADKALYQAKEGGRNRSVAAGCQLYAPP